MTSFTTDLPINEIFPNVIEHLRGNNTLIINAPPGAGKSTTIPLLLLNQPFLNGKKILMLEPRRLAARTIASRMTSLIGENVGETVGYRIRFENKISNQTKIEVVTEGILTRMLQTDNSLSEVGVVIFDEFHERSIHADLALALCREAQEVLRPDLKIVVMSATLNLPQLTSLLNTKAITSQGKQFDVKIHYGSGIDIRHVSELAAQTTILAVKNNPGDCLIFLPGQAEILRCSTILKQQLPDFAIHPLYGQLSQSKQYHALIPDKKGKRKIVIATSIAETSLTIEGIRIVVDSGLSRTATFDPKSGLLRLETMPVSVDSADQRAGRAGRLSEGCCYRLWSLSDHAKLKLHSTPEILETDLSSLVLDMAQWGVDDITKLCWLDIPPLSKLQMAQETLTSINALSNNKITEHGRMIHKLPCHPRIAHMLLMAQDEGLAHLACDVAAIIEERDPLPVGSGIDINLRIDALRLYRKNEKGDNSFRHIEKIASQYRKMLNIDEDNSSHDSYETGLLLSFAYPERIACSRPGNNAQFQMANGRIAMIGHKDDLAYESWLSVAHVDARDGLGKIFLASPLNPKDLAALVKKRDIIEWNVKKGGLIANSELHIGNIVLQSKPLQIDNYNIINNAICSALKKEGQALLDFNENVQQWQNRIISLKIWQPELDLPNVSTDVLLLNCERWIVPYLAGIKKNEDLKKLNLKEILQCSLTWEQQQLLDQLAPERINVPSGSFIKIEYFENGALPVLAVKLQEVFGLQKTPSVNNGRTSLLIHLLSPAFRLVQITSDLTSFWNNAYHDVRKELRIKYPKHSWPENPIDAKAQRK